MRFFVVASKGKLPVLYILYKWYERIILVGKWRNLKVYAILKQLKLCDL